MAEATTTEQELEGAEPEATEVKPKGKKGKAAAAAAGDEEISKDEAYLLECGWTRSDSGKRWKDPHKGKKTFYNDIGQREYPSEHRAYSTDEAVDIQRRYEETARLEKKEREELEKRRKSGKGLVGTTA